jgi:type 1 glutamine amidotransferase
LPFAAAIPVRAQAPFATHLKKVLVLDKSQGGANGHLESRRDFNQAMAALAADRGFQVVTIGQNDSAAVVDRAFSATSLAQYQVVLFSSNDGVDQQMGAAAKASFEAYVRGGGGFIAVHAASAFIFNWPFMTEALVQVFYGPFAWNSTTAKPVQDSDGLREGSETRGIFRGLEVPAKFMDEFYSFRASPRGTAGVTILLTVDEKTFSQTLNGPMGDDHPVVWAKSVGKGRVVSNSLGHSSSTNNTYTEEKGYLKSLLYGMLRYAAGDFTGCTDNGYKEYNPDATRSDTAACRTPTDADPISLRLPEAGILWIMPRQAGDPIRVDFTSRGNHEVTLLDLAGKAVAGRTGTGPARYSLSAPKSRGVYVLKAKAGGKTVTRRVTVL